MVKTTVNEKCFHCNGTGESETEVPLFVLLTLVSMMTDSRNRKIEAIKYMRTHTQTSLKTAKDYVEQVITPFVDDVENNMRV